MISSADSFVPFSDAIDSKFFLSFENLRSTSDDKSIDNAISNQSTVKIQLDNEVRCDVCSVIVTSEICYQLHLQGRKHKKCQQARLLEDPSYCSPTFDKLRNQRILSTNDPLTTNKSISATPARYTCLLCNIVCQSEEAYADHLHGRRHAVNSKRKNPDFMDETENQCVTETASTVVTSGNFTIDNEKNSIVEKGDTFENSKSTSNSAAIENDTVGYIPDVTGSLSSTLTRTKLVDEIVDERQKNAQTQHTFDLEPDRTAVHHPKKQKHPVIPEQSNQSWGNHSRKPMHRKTHNSFVNSNQRIDRSVRSNRVASSRINSLMHDPLQQQAALNLFSPIQYGVNGYDKNRHSRTSSNYYQAPSVYQNEFFYPNSVSTNYQGPTSNSNVGKSTPKSDPTLSFCLDYSSNQGLNSNYEYNYISSYSSVHRMTDNPFNYPNNAYQ